MIPGAAPEMASPVESESESLVLQELRTMERVAADAGALVAHDVAIPGFVGVEGIIFEIEIGIVGVVVLEFVGLIFCE